MSVALNTSNQAENHEVVKLINFHPATEEVYEVDGHEESDSADNQFTDDAVVDVPETESM